MRKHKLLIVSIVVLVLVVAVGAASAQGQAGNGRNSNGNGFGRQGNGQGMLNGQGQPNGQGMLNGQGQFNGQGQPDGTTNNFGRGARWNSEDATNQLPPMGFNLPPAVEGDLPEDVIAAITAGLMDEHNAYNVYQAVIDQFGTIRPFTNIQRAEAQHIAALEVIFDRYGVEVPAVPALDTVPTFTSLTDACQAAADAEIANFALYDEWLETVSDYPDITQVFTALRNASEFNHLPVFENCAG
jgi:hypothetical protein